MENAKPIKIKATTFWASLTKPNEMSGQYQVDFGKLSKAAVTALEQLGVSVKNKGDDREFFITCKSQHPIRAYTTDGEEMKDPIVGNGSEVIAVIGTYAWSFKNKKGVSASIKKLTVTNLVEYKAGDLDADDVDAVGTADLVEDTIL